MITDVRMKNRGLEAAIKAFRRSVKHVDTVYAIRKWIAPEMRGYSGRYRKVEDKKCYRIAKKYKLRFA